MEQLPVMFASQHYNNDCLELPDTEAISHLSMKTSLEGSERSPMQVTPQHITINSGVTTEL